MTYGIKILLPWCQANANWSLQGQRDCPLCRTKLAPLSESGGTVELEIVACIKVAFLVEMVADRRFERRRISARFASSENAAWRVLVELAVVNSQRGYSANGLFLVGQHCRDIQRKLRVSPTPREYRQRPQSLLLSIVATRRCGDNRSGASVPKARQAPLHSPSSAILDRISGAIISVLVLATPKTAPIYTH